MDKAFGVVVEGDDIEGTLEFNTRTGSVEIREVSKHPLVTLQCQFNNHM